MLFQDAVKHKRLRCNKGIYISKLWSESGPSASPIRERKGKVYRLAEVRKFVNDTLAGRLLPATAVYLAWVFLTHKQNILLLSIPTLQTHLVRQPRHLLYLYPSRKSSLTKLAGGLSAAGS